MNSQWELRDHNHNSQHFPSVIPTEYVDFWVSLENTQY